MRAPWIAMSAHVSTAIAMAVLFIAGTLKGIDVPSFMQALLTWSHIPPGAVPFLALLVPAVEIGISLAWFFDVNRRLMVMCALALLTSFTALFMFHLLNDIAPDCGCFGQALAHQNATVQSMILLIKNLLLCGALLLGVLIPYQGRIVSCFNF